MHEWLPLEELTDEKLANVNKVKADTDVALVGAGVLAPEESRQRLAGDEDSGYQDIDPNAVPEPPATGLEGEEGQPGQEQALGGEEDEASQMFPRIGTHVRRVEGAEPGGARRPEVDRAGGERHGSGTRGQRDDDRDDRGSRARTWEGATS